MPECARYVGFVLTPVLPGGFDCNAKTTCQAALRVSPSIRKSGRASTTRERSRAGLQMSTEKSAENDFLSTARSQEDSEEKSTHSVASESTASDHAVSTSSVPQSDIRKQLSSQPGKPRVPVLMCDVLDTIVTDPFTHGMAEHLGFGSFQEFLDAKAPEAWKYFELGHMSEEQLSLSFFKDPSRRLDVASLKKFLLESYQFNPGMEEMIAGMCGLGIRIHAISNYPIWFTLIEKSLRLERKHGVRWTFVSACEGLRKPSVEAFQRAAHNANVSVSDCILLDDQRANCEGARAAGYGSAIKFDSVEQAREDLRKLYEPYFLEFPAKSGT